MKKYDCIVLGMGGVGSAALWAAAKRGWSVLGIDRFGTAHDRGSSHGQTRIIRRAYYEHPNYVPLVEQSYLFWDELTKRHRTSPDVKPLLIQTGLLQVGRPESEVIRGVQASAKAFDLPIEIFTPQEIEERLPILRIPKNHIGLLETGAGILRVELCVAAMIQQARKLGAEILVDQPVSSWAVNDSGEVEVRMGDHAFKAERLVIAAGSWSSQVLADLKLPLQVIRKQQHWFQLDRVEQKLINRFPTFLFEQENGEVFYGMPEIDYLGMKVAEHTGGDAVNDPSELNRDLNEDDLRRTVEFLKNHFHFSHHRLVHFSQCMYTMSPDSHFVVDQYPGFPQVAYAAGLSGHGFKFAPTLGHYLIQLVEGEYREEFAFLRHRFQSSSRKA